MKNHFLPFLLFSLFSLITFTSFAQETTYQKAMKKEIAKVISTDSLPQLQQSANAFARIAELNPKEWQPFYYQALAYTFQGLNKDLSMDKKDASLSQAEELARKADALSPNNAEIVALQGFVTMAKLSADPASRGQSLSGLALQTFGKALAIDKQNPRALILMAQMELGMAKFFGSGTEKACGLAKQSLAVFDSQDEEALKAAILPTWGKNMAKGVAKNCP
jgi:tetratricopeptide (TPR) repeat protein